MYDLKQLALGGTLTLLALGAAWAFYRLVRGIRNAWVEYRNIRLSVPELRRVTSQIQAQIVASEFRNYTQSINVPEAVKPANESGTHRRVSEPPPLPDDGWEDDELKTELPASGQR